MADAVGKAEFSVARHVQRQYHRSWFIAYAVLKTRFDLETHLDITR